MKISEDIINFVKKIDWLDSQHPYGGACVRINDDKIVYIDPANLKDEDMKLKADLILITHSHEDHFSVETIEKLVKPNTIIVCPSDCEESLSQDHFDFTIHVIKPGETIHLGKIGIEVIPAYSSSAHPISANWVGYVIELNNFRIYHSGDSGYIPEMKNLNNIDISFLTVREPYMMSPEELIKAAETIKPKILIPIHWIEEERSSIDYILKNTPKSIKVIIPEKK